MTQLPIPVHVGSESPERWDDIEARQREFGDDAHSSLRDKRRPTVASHDLDWRGVGFEPRWLGFDAADCAAALQPSIFSGQGANEFGRFRHGGKSRAEIALVISPIGHSGDNPRTTLFGDDDSVLIGNSYTSVSSRPIGQGAAVRAADGLTDADGQLARRMLSCRAPLRWRGLSLNGAMLETPGGREQHPGQGSLLPILQTELGEPVLAAWVSPDGVERRYLVPVETPWLLLLAWLAEQALPELVPGAMRRARRLLAGDQDLMTSRERGLRAALAELDMDYASRRSALSQELEEVQGAASTIREGLLYGTGDQLADAVRSVFESAGIAVINLDKKLGGTTNADLLCTFNGRSRLVEVKSASGRASEDAYQALLRHLGQWPSLPGTVPVEGGALVISHEIRTLPLERSPRPYGRPEFLYAQTHRVITALDLFAAWRKEDADIIRRLLFGSATRSSDAAGPGQQHGGGARNQADRIRRWPAMLFQRRREVP